MSNPNYTLEVISHHPQFDNKSLRKYYVEGIDTVGAWGNEPFEIRFKNNTWQKIQVKLSVDGTDIFTGKPADTSASDKMWVVNGYGTLSIKAWPENNNGGASFVFTHAGNSVATHTHGDMTSRGIIAAAVFVEGHKPEPVRIQEHYYHYNPYYYPSTYTLTSGSILNTPTNWGDCFGGVVSTNSIQTNSVLSSVGQNSVSMDSVFLNDARGDSEAVPTGASAERRSLQSLAAVGAGQHVDQKISYVEGLTKPLFTETVRVRYVWYDDLVKLLQEHNAPAPHPSGFPGDRERSINLGTTPRLGTFRRVGQSQVVYSRF
jgi:hypothetical protein